MAKSRNPSLGQVSDFDIRLLRIFKTIVECGSFSAAESTLGLSRSAISLHMGDLEKRLGMRLCQRGRAGFALTDEGREVYRATQTLLAALEGFRAEVNDLHQHLRGELNIGIINNLVTLPQMRITHALSALKGQGPQVRINIGMTTPNEIELGVLDGHLHVGVVPLISPLSGLGTCRCMTSTRSSIAAAATHCSSAPTAISRWTRCSPRTPWRPATACPPKPRRATRS